MSNLTSPSGHPTEEARKTHATLPGGRFPVYDEHSAKSALHLRGHGTTPEERSKIIEHAARYAPEAAAKARAEDSGS